MSWDTLIDDVAAFQAMVGAVNGATVGLAPGCVAEQLGVRVGAPLGRQHRDGD